jgi:glycosyltransferase involved in cell wall biosynthesis
MTSTRERRGERERPRRLCAIVHADFPSDPRVLRAVRVAIEEGWEVDVLATRQPGERAKEVVEGARVRRLPIAHRRGRGVLRVAAEYLGFTLLATAQASRLAGRRHYSAVHVHNPPDFLIVAATVPKLLGAKVIFDVHDLSDDMFAMRFGSRRGARFLDRILRLLETAATRFADFVITVHEPYRDELARRGVPPEKTAVVMNTVDERLLPPARQEKKDDGFRIVYHGTVTPPYGLNLLVEAVARLADDVSDARLEIYGDGDAVPEIKALVERLGVAERVTLSARYLPHAEVLERVQLASVGVIPNLPVRFNRLALSTKLFEYVALGIPVVCADLGAIRDHFSDEEMLFFTAGRADALTSALLETWRDPAAAAARSRAALDRYEGYRWPAQARRYAEVLDRSVEPVHRRRRYASAVSDRSSESSSR